MLGFCVCGIAQSSRLGLVEKLVERDVDTEQPQLKVGSKKKLIAWYTSHSG